MQHQERGELVHRSQPLQVVVGLQDHLLSHYRRGTCPSVRCPLSEASRLSGGCTKCAISDKQSGEKDFWVRSRQRSIAGPGHSFGGEGAQRLCSYAQGGQRLKCCIQEAFLLETPLRKTRPKKRPTHQLQIADQGPSGHVGSGAGCAALSGPDLVLNHDRCIPRLAAANGRVFLHPMLASLLGHGNRVAWRRSKSVGEIGALLRLLGIPTLGDCQGLQRPPKSPLEQEIYIFKVPSSCPPQRHQTLFPHLVASSSVPGDPSRVVASGKLL